MKPKLFLFGIVFLLCVGWVSAAIPDPSFFWTLDNDYTDGNTVVDFFDSHNGTWKGATTGETTHCWQNQCYNINGAGYINSTGDITGDFRTIMFVLRPNTTITTASASQTILSHKTDAAWHLTLGALSGGFADETMTLPTGGGALTYTKGNINNSQPHIIVWSYNASLATNYKVFMDGQELTTFDDGTPAALLTGQDIVIGRRGDDANYVTGSIDYIAIWPYTLNNSQIEELWNGGTATSYPYDPIFTITAQNNRTGNSINTFNATLTNGTTTLNYNTTNGTIRIGVFTNSTTLWNITVRAENFFDNTSNNYNVSSNLAAELIPYTIINATTASGTKINNFSINYAIQGNSTVINTESTSSGQVNLPLFNNSYTVTIFDANQGGTNYESKSVNLTADDYIASHTFELFQSNSFNITIYDEQTRQIINDRNVTIEIISDLEANNYTTSNGTLEINALMPAEIEIRYNAPSYDERSYYFFLRNQTYNNIELYLLNTTASTLIIATTLDESGAPVTGVTTQLKRGYIIDGQEVFKIVEMDKSDFGGENVFYVELNTVPYSWTVLRNLSQNQILFTSASSEVTSTTIEFKLNVLGDPLQTFNYITGQGLDNMVTTNPTYDNNSKTWNATYSILDSTIVQKVCLVVEQITDFGKRVVNQTCTTANSASLNVGYDDSRGSIATLKLQRTGQPDFPLAVSTFNPDEPWENSGSDGVFVSIWIVSTLGMALINTPTTLIVGGLSGLLSAIALGLVGWSWLAFIPILITGGILIFKMSR